MSSPARDWANDAERHAWLWHVDPADEHAKLKWLLQRWRVDPVLYCIECLRMVPMPYQAHMLLDLADAPAEVYAFYELDGTNAKRQVLASSGHGLGKTRTEACAIHWFKDTHRFSKTLVTAPTADQISGQLWGEITKLHRRQKERWEIISREWEILGSSIAHRNPDFADWHVTARTARADKPEGLQGAHGQDADDEFGELAELFGEEIETGAAGGMLIVVEEGSGVPNEIRQTLEGALSEPGARLLGMGNPTRPDGWFAEHQDRRDRYGVHTLDCRQSDATKVYRLPYRDFAGRTVSLRVRGRVEPRYWLDILEECGGDEDHDRFRVRVRGVKPRSAFEQCIKTHWVEEAESRPRDKDSDVHPVIVSLDFGLTSDKHALAVRQGFNCLDGEEWLPPDRPDQVTLAAADRAIEAVKLYHAHYIIGDANGVGRGAMEYLARYYHDAHPTLGVRVIFFNAGAGAGDAKRYHRRRDEMWHREGRAWFANPRCSIPKLPGLKRQLAVHGPGYHEDTAKRIKVESKDDVHKRTGEPSGNLADALLQSLMVFVPSHETDPKDKQPEVPPQPKVFAEHFTRLRARELLTHGPLIR